MSNNHSSNSPEYHNEVEILELELKRRGNTYPITKSLIELWKYIFQNYPKVAEVHIPDYPDYIRALVEPTAFIKTNVDLTFIDKFDMEYFRVVEFFASRAIHKGMFKIDLSFYDVNKGVYWMDIAPLQVIRGYLAT